LRPEGDAGYVVTGERQLLATFGQTFAFIVVLAWPGQVRDLKRGVTTVAAPVYDLYFFTFLSDCVRPILHRAVSQQPQ
jgi:hypothetical protein